MDPINWKQEIVEPADILDGLKSIEGKTVWTHPMTPEGWLRAETLYEWARAGMSNPNKLGWDVGVSYAKRAVCRRIDGFLANNWLDQFGGRKYPEKIDILRQIGISIPAIVHRLVIGSRNEIEHDYQSVSSDDAADAVDVAHLMLSATAGEVPREPVVMAGGHIDVATGITSSEPRFEFHRVDSLKIDPLLFVDFLVNPRQVKLVYPKDEEIRYAELNKFKKDDAIAFAKHLRSYRPSQIGLGLFGVPKELMPTVLRFQEFKRQTGI
jgi:hypothetical protein